MTDIIKTFFFLFAVIDPIGAIPIFLEATKQFDQKIKRSIAIKSSLIAGGVLIFFIVIGQVIMESMHITLSAFQVSGGIILFLFSLTMVFGHGKASDDKALFKDYNHVTIFPVAMPGIASPGAIMAVVLATDNHIYTIREQVFTTFIVILVILTTMLMLLVARKIHERIGEAGTIVITQIMGLIIASFAVQSIMTGIKEYFNL